MISVVYFGDKTMLWLDFLFPRVSFEEKNSTSDVFNSAIHQCYAWHYSYCLVTGGEHLFPELFYMTNATICLYIVEHVLHVRPLVSQKMWMIASIFKDFHSYNRVFKFLRFVKKQHYTI